MNDEKKVKATQEEAKTEENGTELTDEELEQVVGGRSIDSPSIYPL